MTPVLAVDGDVGKRHGWTLLAILIALLLSVCGVDTDNAAALPGHDDCSMQAATTGASSSLVPAAPHSVAVVASIVAPVLLLFASEHSDFETVPPKDRPGRSSASPRSPPLG